MASISCQPTNNTLLTFDATKLLRHISPNDDKRMVDYVIRNYGPALQHALQYYHESHKDMAGLMHFYYNDAYYTAAVDEAEYNSVDSNPDVPSFFRRTVTESGMVIAKKARYDELVEACIECFNHEIAAYVRGIQMSQVRQIYTVRVVGYENRILKVLVSTDGPINP